MAVNIALTTKIRVNGQEYTRVDDIPPDIRKAYERALVMLRGGQPSGQPDVSATPRNVQAAASARVVFNGHEYPCVDQTPIEIRQLYEEVMATLAAPPRATSVGLPEAARTIRLAAENHCAALGSVLPESTRSSLIIAGFVIAALFLASFALAR